ncbi:hypothetical protein FB567DRAFT_178632 [Paraphoma chrysanthemicola]|uniref:F-box domain-containing protein n=1 Tax=Paraphoma chrysanthemicola TaxID=798071 RepID=A0A8K0W3D4_9PLEO|nr:hypothetical protein FB567DRAFT_178632 [Paraphoma chrysanthemicola]
MAITTLPQLPAELWGQICSYMDDFTLWIVFRQISRTLRQEAEREFATNRLPNLQITYSCQLMSTTASNLTYNCSTNGTTRLIGLSPDGTRARFRVATVNNVCKKSELYLEPTAEEIAQTSRLASATISQALQNADIRFALNNFSEVQSSAVLGFYANDNGVPGCQVDLENLECSFEWKPFFDAFYGDYAYVGKVLRPWDPFNALIEMPGTAEIDLLKNLPWHGTRFQDQWISTHGALLDAPFVRAYTERLKRVMGNIGGEFVLSVSRLEAVKERVEKVRRLRNKSMLDCALKKAGIGMERGCGGMTGHDLYFLAGA